jgi:hypothetical protein
MAVVLQSAIYNNHKSSLWNLPLNLYIRSK